MMWTGEGRPRGREQIEWRDALPTTPCHRLAGSLPWTEKLKSQSTCYSMPSRSKMTQGPLRAPECGTRDTRATQ